MVLDLDGTDGLLHAVDLGAGLEDVHIGIAGLPDTVVFVVIEAVQRISDEPGVSFVAVGTVRQGDKLVAVGIDVQTGGPGPVTVLDDRPVEGELDTAVLRGTDVGGTVQKVFGASTRSLPRPLLSFFSWF